MYKRNFKVFFSFIFKVYCVLQNQFLRLISDTLEKKKRKSITLRTFDEAEKKEEKKRSITHAFYDDSVRRLAHINAKLQGTLPPRIK